MPKPHPNSNKHLGTDIANKEFYKQYTQYQATVYTWGVTSSTLGVAPNKAAKAMLFGGNVGHAAINLTFPVNENNTKLINTYITSNHIPYEIITDEHQNKIYKVYFSVWPSHEKTLRLSSSLISDQLDERYGVAYDYKKHDLKNEVFERLQQVQMPTRGLLTDLQNTITLPPTITIEYKHFNENDIKAIKKAIETIQTNPQIKTMNIQEIEKMINAMPINITNPQDLSLTKMLLQFKCLEVQMIKKELEIYSYIKELIKLKQSYTQSSKSLHDEAASDFDDNDDSLITSILATITLATSAINITRNKTDEFHFKTANIIPTDDEKPIRNPELGTTKEEDYIKLLAAAKKTRTELRQSITELYNSHNKELSLERYIKIGHEPQGVVNIPIYESENKVGLELPAMLKKMAEIATTKKPFNLLKNNCASSVLAILNNGIAQNCNNVFSITTPDFVHRRAAALDDFMMYKGINKYDNAKDIRQAMKRLQESRGSIMMDKLNDALHQVKEFFINARKYLFYKTNKHKKVLFGNNLASTTNSPKLNSQQTPKNPKGFPNKE